MKDYLGWNVEILIRWMQPWMHIAADLAPTALQKMEHGISQKGTFKVQNHTRLHATIFLVAETTELAISKKKSLDHLVVILQFLQKWLYYSKERREHTVRLCAKSTANIFRLLCCFGNFSYLDIPLMYCIDYSSHPKCWATKKAAAIASLFFYRPK